MFPEMQEFVMMDTMPGFNNVTIVTILIQI